MTQRIDLLPEDTMTSNWITSVDLVKAINQCRDVRKSAMRHDQLLVKIRKEFDSEWLMTHENTYTDKYGNSRPCYFMQQREAHIMLMSESAAVRAKIYDKLRDLYNQVDEL